MRRTIPFILAACAILAACKPRHRASEPGASTPDSLATRYQVNTLIGTGGHGHTFPGPTLPFGMIQPGPDTRLDGWDGCSGYHDTDSILHGFSHTHLSGTGVSDYGDLLVMPKADTIQKGTIQYATRIHKASELAREGYYSVMMPKEGITAEMTATTRCAIHRWTPSAAGPMSVLIDLKHRDPVTASGLEWVSPTRLEGYRVSNAWAKDQHFYFVMEFSRPVQTLLFEGEAGGQKKKVGADVRAQAQFAASDEPLLLRVAMSGVDVEGARRNLAAEMPDFAFDIVKEEAQGTWENALSRIRVKGGNLRDRTIFYTALYHTLIVPNTWSDVDGRYRGMDGRIHHLPPGDTQYTVFSLWDTFRAAHPLYTIIERDRTAAFIRTFIRMSAQADLPVWELAANETRCMIGYHSASVIADAHLKGITGFDTQAALKALLKTATNPQHPGLDAYRAKGVIEAGDDAESVSKTLEYAYDDWCIARLAAALGDTATERAFMARARSYRNLYDPATGFFRARMNGGWMPRFDPSEVNFNYTEANAWQYSLFAPQDIGGLMALHGGKAGLERHLDDLFSADSRTTGREQADITGLIGQYAHGNEPSHHMAYLYAHCGAAHKTQALVRKIMREFYANAPDGLIGNEDCGQMSAWLVMSAIGLYPVTPGSPHYTIGSPWFPEAEINLEDGKTFRVIAQGNAEDEPRVSKATPYIASATLNGRQWRKPWIPHDSILAGGELRLVMSTSPVPGWFNEEDQFPGLHMGGEVLPAMPSIQAASQTFTDSLLVTISSPDPSARFRVSFDPLTPPGPQAPVYQGPITLRSDARLRVVAELPSGRMSQPVEASFHKIDGSRSIRLASQYANQYAAGGDNALIDRLRGGPNFRTGRWQGYQEDLEATVDLGAVKPVQHIACGFLQDIGSWIWMPTQVEFMVSVDGSTWTSLGAIKPTVPDRDYTARTHDFSPQVPPRTQARYVKVRARNYGTCPPWHLGAGGTTWIFADEITIE